MLAPQFSLPHKQPRSLRELGKVRPAIFSVELPISRTGKSARIATCRWPCQQVADARDNIRGVNLHRYLFI